MANKVYSDAKSALAGLLRNDMTLVHGSLPCWLR
jgi:hypothetical protein